MIVLCKKKNKEKIIIITISLTERHKKINIPRRRVDPRTIFNINKVHYSPGNIICRKPSAIELLTIVNPAKPLGLNYGQRQTEGRQERIKKKTPPYQTGISTGQFFLERTNSCKLSSRNWPTIILTHSR